MRRPPFNGGYRNTFPTYPEQGEAAPSAGPQTGGEDPAPLPPAPPPPAPPPSKDTGGRHTARILTVCALILAALLAGAVWSAFGPGDAPGKTTPPAITPPAQSQAAPLAAPTLTPTPSPTPAPTPTPTPAQPGAILAIGQELTPSFGAQDLTLEGRPFEEWGEEELMAWLPAAEYTFDYGTPEEEEYFSRRYFANGSISAGAYPRDGARWLQLTWDALQEGFEGEYSFPALPRGIEMGDSPADVIEKLGLDMPQSVLMPCGEGWLYFPGEYTKYPDMPFPYYMVLYPTEQADPQNPEYLRLYFTNNDDFYGADHTTLASLELLFRAGRLEACTMERPCPRK